LKTLSLSVCAKYYLKYLILYLIWIINANVLHELFQPFRANLPDNSNSKGRGASVCPFLFLLELIMYCVPRTKGTLTAVLLFAQGTQPLLSPPPSSAVPALEGDLSA
jgi:hypothetical protein